MKLLPHKYIIAFVIVLINLLSQCLFYINWSWNLTAFVRVFTPILLFRYLDPVVAMIILEGVLDSIEPSISRNNIEYHTRDKLLDLWGWFISVIALWTTIKNKHLLKYRNILTILFIIRAVGNIMFIKTKNRKWLACCPNLYSCWFIIIPILEYFKLSKYKFNLLIVILTFIKMGTEYIHHGSNVKENIKPFRKYTKWICPGKAKMYMMTGTFPRNLKKENSPAPLLI